MPIIQAEMGSDFLFASPSWLSGVARTLDLTGQFDEYNTSRDDSHADARAHFLDWQAVGDFLVDAAQSFRPQTTPATTRPAE